MRKSDFNQSVSIAIVLNAYLRTDGTSTIYMRVIISRQKREFNLNESWPRVNFNEERGCANARYPNDPDVERVNMIIAEAAGRANKIKLRFFADSRTLTHELFEREFTSFMAGDNFMLYWKRKQSMQTTELIITGETSKHQTTSYNRLNEYLGGGEFLPFFDINLNFIERFNAWMRKKKKLSHNTACTTHKTIKTYLMHAQRDKFKFDNPYLFFKYTFRDGERAVLHQDEIRRLEALYEKESLEDLAQEVLAKFLFSCYTGLRISDNGRITDKNIIDGRLRIDLQKGFNSGKKVVLLLPDFALTILKGRKGVIFKEIADQTCNHYLKVIAAKADIKKRLTFHVSRDTFGTEYIERGGDVYSLMGLMGHSDIQTTMIYIKLSERKAEEGMRNFNRKPSTGGSA